MDCKISSDELALSPCERMEHDSECATCNWLNESRLCLSICEKCGPITRTERICSTAQEKQLMPIAPTQTESRVAECCSSITINEPESTMNRSASFQNNLVRGDILPECTSNRCGCNLRTSTVSRVNVQNQENNRKNLSIVLASLLQSKSRSNKPDNSYQHGPEPEHYSHGDIAAEPRGNDNSGIKLLFNRIATWEQRSHAQEEKIAQLTSLLNRLIGLKIFSIIAPNPQNCCGVLVWKISDFFARKVDGMQNNPNVMHYSSDFYTAPFGYRFCARISMPPKAKEKDSIGLHVHMMQSDNDHHLDWPFRGCIKISMIHNNAKFSVHDKIMTNEKSTAFQRPVSDISSHSFGFAEYTTIATIRENGFVSDDVLTIKIQITIV